MALEVAYEGSFSVSTTELSMVSGTSTLQTITAEPGVYQLFLDLNALVNGDVFEVRIYERVVSGGTKRIVTPFTLADAQGADHAIWAGPALQLMHGWDFTIIRTAGSDRTIAYSLRRVA